MSAIRTARKKLGLTQTALGAMVGVAASEISRFECGRAIPSPLQRRRLACALNVADAELVPTGDGDALVNRMLEAIETVVCAVITEGDPGALAEG